MLTCKEQVARSSDYLDGQLSLRERLLMRHHLLFCPNCRRFIKQMRLLQATLKQLPDSQPETLDLDALARNLAEQAKNVKKT